MKENGKSGGVSPEKTVPETRIAVVGIIIESQESVSKVNEILHQYGSHIIGRMGIPYREKKLNIISVVLDAPADVISAVSGKLGRLSGSVPRRFTHGLREIQRIV